LRAVAVVGACEATSRFNLSLHDFNARFHFTLSIEAFASRFQSNHAIPSCDRILRPILNADLSASQ
jgi:hypothetical protein